MTDLVRQRFVYVEDDPAQREIMGALFKYGRLWNDLQCVEGVRAFERYLDDPNTPPIDVLIVDWRLRDGVGADVITRARTHDKARQAVILSASAVSERAQIAEADRAGSHYWLEKPLSVQIIKDALTAINGFGEVIVRKKK